MNDPDSGEPSTTGSRPTLGVPVGERFHVGLGPERRDTPTPNDRPHTLLVPRAQCINGWSSRSQGPGRRRRDQKRARNSPETSWGTGNREPEAEFGSGREAEGASIERRPGGKSSVERSIPRVGASTRAALGVCACASDGRADGEVTELCSN